MWKQALSAVCGAVFGIALIVTCSTPGVDDTYAATPSCQQWEIMSASFTALGSEWVDAPVAGEQVLVAPAPVGWEPYAYSGSNPLFRRCLP